MRWRYIELETTDPAFNLAAEEYVFECLPKEYAYFMLWQNEPSVIIGRHQNTLAEINQAHIREKGIHVVRRLSGGGAAYHDLGNLNLTFVRDAESKRLDLGFFCQPVAHALQELGVPAEVNGRNDITVEGKKFSGNAQYVREGRVMHHGTLLICADLQQAALALKPPVEKLQSKGVASVRSRITTLQEYLPQGVGLDEFKEHFLSHLFDREQMEHYVLTQEDRRQIQRIRDSRYALREWNYGQSPPCDLVLQGRIPDCGTLSFHFSVQKGMIAKAELHGDFFSLRDPEVLASCFVGVEPNGEGFASALKKVEPSEIIRALSREALLELLNQ